MAALLGIIGAACILYFFAIILYAGIHTAFSEFWLIVGILCLGGMAFIRGINWFPKWKKMLLWIRVCVQTTAIALTAIFIVTEGLIIAEMNRKPPEHLDYVVVIGSKISGNQSAPTMDHCLKATLEYLNKNPETKVIVSGMESDYPNLTQAQIMYAWLLGHGVEPRRIYMENSANSVKENVANSYIIIDHNWYEEGEHPKEEEPTVAIVTMNFHVFRAKKIAEAAGYDVSAIPSKPDYILEMNYMAREFFCVIGDKLMGYI